MQWPTLSMYEDQQPKLAQKVVAFVDRSNNKKIRWIPPWCNVDKPEISYVQVQHLVGRKKMEIVD